MRKLLLVTLLALAAMVFVAAPAQAQSNCAPMSGTVYGALYGGSWHLLGDFTIGDRVYPAAIAVKMNFNNTTNPDMWQGSEAWTFDFGDGNTLEMTTSFVTEHMTNTGKIFHIREVGTFTAGTGAFKHLVGTLTAEGPFGKGVTLPAGVALPAGNYNYWVAPTQGIVCGMNGR